MYNESIYLFTHIEKLTIMNLKNKIEKTLKEVLPEQCFLILKEREFLGEKSLIIGFAANDHKINNVSWQYPQFVSLMLHYSDMDIHPQNVGGSGGRCIYRKPNLDDDNEKYLAMKGVKIPFRKPKPTEEAILKAIERFAQRWLGLLKDNRNELQYQNIVDYDKLLVT